METHTTFAEVIKRAGGATALAAALTRDTETVSLQMISNWKERGFPPNRCKAIEALTGVSVRQLRPDDWRDYWPEQAQAEAEGR